MRQTFALSFALACLAVSAPATAEPRRKCDVDSNRLTGSFFLIAPDGRFCEASAEEERRYSEALDASQQAADAQAEAERLAALAKFKSEMRRAMIEGGSTARDADRAIAEVLGSSNAQSVARPAARPAGTQQAQSSQPNPAAPGRCMGKSGKNGTPCVPLPNLGGVGKAIASRGLGY